MPTTMVRPSFFTFFLVPRLCTHSGCTRAVFNAGSSWPSLANIGQTTVGHPAHGGQFSRSIGDLYECPNNTALTFLWTAYSSVQIRLDRGVPAVAMTGVRGGPGPTRHRGVASFFAFFLAACYDLRTLVARTLVKACRFSCWQVWPSSANNGSRTAIGQTSPRLDRSSAEQLVSSFGNFGASGEQICPVDSGKLCSQPCPVPFQTVFCLGGCWGGDCRDCPSCNMRGKSCNVFRKAF